MAQWIVPIASLQAFDSIDVALSGVAYRLQFYWNGRDGSNNPAGGSWNLSLLDTSDNPIATGIKLVLGGYLLAPFALENPPGNLFLVDQSGQDLDPGFGDLGSRVLMVYDDLGVA